MLREPGLHDSLWAASAPPAPVTQPLAGEVRADVAIVGAGFTGCSAALHLAQAGAEVVVLEANEVGWGGSGRNAGFVNAGLWLPPDEVERRVGKKHGERINAALDKAPELVAELVERHGIDCDFRRSGMLRGGHSARGMRELRTQVEQWRARGAAIELLDRARTAELVGNDLYVGGLLDHRAGQIQPLSYARGLARAALEAGAAIHTDTRVTAMRRTGGRWELTTAAGIVRADAVILATNAYSDRLWPGVRETIVPIGTFAYATEPLTDNLRASLLPGGHGFYDTQPAMVFIHIDRDRRVIMGTLGKLPLAPDPRRASAWVNRVRRRMFPQLADQPWAFKWAGTIGFTTDHIPRVYEPAPGLHMALGYNGRGIAPGTFWGKTLAQRALGRLSAEDLPLPVTPVRPASLRPLRIAFFDLAFRAYRLKSLVR